MVIVMVIGFSGLILITALSYRNALPSPAHVVDAQGALLFSAEDVGDGQAGFLRYSLNGQRQHLGPLRLGLTI
jgi:nitric oxide reductase subunit B